MNPMLRIKLAGFTASLLLGNALGALVVFEPFNYDNTSYPNGMSGQEGGFGFSSPWNDADGDTQDRIIGGSQLGDGGSDMAPASSGGRSIHWNNTGTGIYRDLAETYGEDGTTVWVSYRWISTDVANPENLNAVDFNRDPGAFGLVIGQVRGLAGDNASDGMYDLAHHPSTVSTDLAIRDQASHYVVVRFTFGAGNNDSVDVWWDPVQGGFSTNSPDAGVTVSNASFDRITLRSAGGADSMDEFRLGTTLADITNTSPRTTSYRIGNSLTWDSQPDGIEALAGQKGLLHDAGYHINCGQSLKAIWENPGTVCVDPVDEYGTFRPALSNHAWSVVAMQPHPGTDSTLRTDQDVFSNVIALARTNPNNTTTRFYLYAAWPTHQDYQTSWTASVANANSTPTVAARDYFEHLIERARSNTTATVLMVPVGEVLYELGRKFRAGDVPGYTNISQLYRDDIHLSYDVGRFVAGLTTLSVLYAENPEGVVKPQSYYGATSTPFTPELMGTIYTTIWDVVTSHPYTGVVEPEVGITLQGKELFVNYSRSVVHTNTGIRWTDHLVQPDWQHSPAGPEQSVSDNLYRRSVDWTNFLSQAFFTLWR